MIEHVHRFVIPAAYHLLPDQMTTEPATAMLLAIGLQESGFRYRRQTNGGPAHGLWQFEFAGVSGVLRHEKTREHLNVVLHTICYRDLGSRIESCYRIIEDNDTLAAVFARLLLWTLPQALPRQDQPYLGWDQYVSAWRPGRPRPDEWPENFGQAWDLVVAARYPST